MAETAPPQPRHPLVELTLARIREFLREPEAVFWVFVFPVLLAFALGIAFRNTAPGKLRIAVENGGPEAAALAAAISRSSDLEAVSLPPPDAALALRTGKVALVVRVAPSTTGDGRSHSLIYRYDPSRPESRMARLATGGCDPSG